MNVIIETERLLIRPPRLGDAEPVNKAVNEAQNEIVRWETWALDPSLKTTEKFINNGIQYWQDPSPKALPMIIELKSTGEIISASGFNENSNFEAPMLETGYWINTKHAGHGYITEATIAITRFAFEYLYAVRVQICAQKENVKSINVAKRCGFIEEAILKNYKLDCVSKKPCDEVIYVCFGTHMLPSLKMYNLRIIS